MTTLIMFYFKAPNVVKLVKQVKWCEAKLLLSLTLVMNSSVTMLRCKNNIPWKHMSCTHRFSCRDTDCNLQYCIAMANSVSLVTQLDMSYERELSHWVSHPMCGNWNVINFIEIKEWKIKNYFMGNIIKLISVFKRTRCEFDTITLSGFSLF